MAEYICAMIAQCAKRRLRRRGPQHAHTALGHALQDLQSSVRLAAPKAGARARMAAHIRMHVHMRACAH